MVKSLYTGLLAIFFAGCIFQKPVQDNPYDPSCGGASIDSAQSCLKLEVMEVIAPALSFTAAVNKPLDYYFKTTDNCYREKTGLPRGGMVQTGGSMCSLIPHASKLTALQTVSVSFSTVNCPSQITVDASGNVNVNSGVLNGSCGIKMQVTGAGYKGTTPTSETVVAVNIGLLQVNGGNPVDVKATSSGSCQFDIKDTYDNGTVLEYTDGSFTAMPTTGTWTYSGSGGSVDSSGIFTPSGVQGGFTGTITYTGVTAKNLTVALNFPVTIVDGVYVVSGDTGNGCFNKPAGSVQTAINLADALSPKRTVYVAVGNYTANYQASPITIRPGVSLRGGYDMNFTGSTAVGFARSCNAGTMSCLIDNNSSTGSRVINFGDSGITTATVIDGFFIAGTSMQNLVGPTTNIAIFGTFGTPTIQNNVIFGGSPISGTSSFTIKAMDVQSSLNIVGNYIIGGVGPVSAPGGATVEGIYSVNGLNGIIANNVIDAGSNAGRTTTYGLDISNGCHPTLTNNTIISASGMAIYSPLYSGSTSASNSRITNNIFVWGGSGMFVAGIYEQHSHGSPRSMENNAFYRLNSSATTIYNWASASSIATLESYGSWIGGADKARGNILLPTGAEGMPFAKFPSFFTVTSASNTGSTNVLLTSDSACANFTNGDYIEWNTDGIARQISCSSGQLTVTPSLPSAAANVQNVEIRNWKSNTNFTPDFQLAQNGLYTSTNLQIWNNLAYGGKNTSQSVCGAPSGGPGTGDGGEICGSVSADKSGTTRTATIPGGNPVSNNTVPNGSIGATAAIPAGYSMGAYEKD